MCKVYIFIYPMTVCMPKRERCCRLCHCLCCPKPTTTKSCTTEKRNQHPTTPTVHTHTHKHRHMHTHTKLYTRTHTQRGGATSNCRYLNLAYSTYIFHIPYIPVPPAALDFLVCLVVAMLHARAVNRYNERTYSTLKKVTVMSGLYFSLCFFHMHNTNKNF